MSERNLRAGASLIRLGDHTYLIELGRHDKADTWVHKIVGNREGPFRSVLDAISQLEERARLERRGI